jgi:uncharacterized RDD family membrane protein YckC
MPAGWYPDPMSSGASVVRYWDGVRWTQHVQAAPDPAPAPPTPPTGAAPTDRSSTAEPTMPYPTAGPTPAEPPPASYPFGTDPRSVPPTTPYGATPPAGGPDGGYPQGGYPQGGYPAGPYGAAPMTPWAHLRSVTPDGQPLAGWGARFVAWFVDGLITGFIGALVAFPWVSEVIRSYGDFVSQTLDAADSGAAAPDAAAFVTDLLPTLMIVSAISLAVSCVYHVSFLRWRGATPGKMLLGLKVRLREAPGQLPWGTIGLRWIGQNGPSILGLLPYVGSLFGLYPVIDGLWPLWDSKRQALHDKIAKTNVVKTR